MDSPYYTHSRQRSRDYLSVLCLFIVTSSRVRFKFFKIYINTGTYKFSNMLANCYFTYCSLFLVVRSIILLLLLVVQDVLLLLSPECSSLLDVSAQSEPSSGDGIR